MPSPQVLHITSTLTMGDTTVTALQARPALLCSQRTTRTLNWCIAVNYLQHYMLDLVCIQAVGTSACDWGYMPDQNLHHAQPWHD